MGSHAALDVMMARDDMTFSRVLKLDSVMASILN